LIREAYVWLVLMRLLRIRPGMRLQIFLFHKAATPRSVVYALVFAALATGFLLVLVRFVIGPLVRRWHTPWNDGSAELFHVAANERVLTSAPGRRRHAGFWLPGMLVRTNLRLWFFPRAHDAEIGSWPLSALHNIRLEPAPRVAWGYIQGWPARLALDAGELRGGGNGNGNGSGNGASAVSREVFAVAEPEAVLAWFERPGGTATQAPAVQRSSISGRP
jgi:hypothetical protein